MALKFYQVKIENDRLARHYATCIGNIKEENDNYLIVEFTDMVWKMKDNRNTHIGMRFNQLKPYIVEIMGE